ncbi:CUAEP/CCAEP-tail radical SAM (seleno)protein [Candidatus Leptofilum sp.]|uniref:CUAEP/CCAEP-tail radical SAM (seleno)protein n=1 Tax=Candidatus Leptofilum sp. TaxID=3241576 RepID=UPI003B5A5BD3
MFRVTLISTYDLGHQPFGLASPAAWLEAAGAAVSCVDVSVRPFQPHTVQTANLIAFYLPMHTATRLAVPLIQRVQRINQQAHVCAYGLYAPVNEDYLRELGVQTILGGEFEQGLVDLMIALRDGQPLPGLPSVSLARQQFVRPSRTALSPLTSYAHLSTPNGKRVIGYTEASRGCKHLCRHCPIVPVYNGRFRIIQPEVVLADVRQQVAAGAQHITFGDPDFLNGPGHALPLVQALHAEFPNLTYDVTIKIEHLQKHTDALPVLRDTGCAFVVSAVEAVDDEILAILDKGHSREDFIQVARQMRQIGLPLTPTFVTFTPWTTVQGYLDLLALLAELELVEAISPIQYAIRLLIPAESRLLELDDVQNLVAPFDPTALVYPWQHPDPAVDALYEMVFKLVKASQSAGEPRRTLFNRIWQAALALLPEAEQASWAARQPVLTHLARAVPTLSEDWY